MPPVLVRGDSLNVPARPLRRSKAKRRFDVALNVPGAEVRLPALPTIQLNWRWASGALILVLAFLLYTVWNSAAYRVEMVEMVGLERLSANDVNVVLGLLGQSVFMVDPATAKEDLVKAYPELKDVQVSVGLPARVSVTIVERAPIIAWKQGGTEKWIDADGVAFPPRGDVDALMVVEAQDAPLGDAQIFVTSNLFIEADLLQAIQIMATQAPTGTALVYDREHGLGWMDGRGWQAYFGLDFSNMDMKLKVYQQISGEIERQNIHPALVSVEYVHAPYYRMER
jgi:hypothetical protein